MRVPYFRAILTAPFAQEEPMAGRHLDKELLDAMRADAPKATDDQLEAIRRKVAELREIEIERADLEDRLRGLGERSRLIREKELVDIMDAARVPSVTIEAEGNKPRMTIEIGPYYHANIAADWEPDRKQKSFGWLDRYHPGLLRNTYTIDFGKDSRKTQKLLEKFLRQNDIPFSNEFGVPWNTLTAFVREQIEHYKKTPPLDLLGATVGRVAKIKKEKK